MMMTRLSLSLAIAIGAYREDLTVAIPPAGCDGELETEAEMAAHALTNSVGSRGSIYLSYHGKK